MEGMQTMALFCWSHAIITYITFNLVVSVSVGIACLTYESFSALVFTSLYMQVIFSP